MNRWHRRVQHHTVTINRNRSNHRLTGIVALCQEICEYSATRWKRIANCTARTMWNWVVQLARGHSKRVHSKSENFCKVQIYIKYRGEPRDHGKCFKNLAYAAKWHQQFWYSKINDNFLVDLQYNKMRLPMAGASVFAVHRSHWSDRTTWFTRHDVNSGKCRTFGSVLSSNS